jgi:hypothetical protein
MMLPQKPQIMFKVEKRDFLLGVFVELIWTRFEAADRLMEHGQGCFNDVLTDARMGSIHQIRDRIYPACR